MRHLLLVLMLPLAACVATTPRETCEGRVAREINRLDALIEDVEEGLARGYTYEYYPSSSGYARYPYYRYPDPYYRGYVGTGFGICGGGDGFAVCTGTGASTSRRRVAIDPEVERRKLDNLVARRSQLIEEGGAACAAAYPEG